MFRSNHPVLRLLVLVGATAFSASHALAGLSYFLVAERPGQAAHGDSFVVPISDPAQINHARDLIAQGPATAGAPILFADIAAGSGDGVNRDLRAPDLHEWNWHVTKVNGFGDLGIEILDGWPTYVHDNRDTWLNQTNGQIGFWSYTVVKELPNYDPRNPTAVPLPPAALIGGLMMAGVGGWRVISQRRLRDR
jgi:hypothetical protein